MVVIIGGGKRIGLKLAEAYQKDGSVLATYWTSRPASLKETYRLDLRDISAVHKFVKSLKPRSIDLLIYVSSTFYPVEFGKTQESKWNDLIDVNLKAAYFLCETIRPKMKKGGSIQFFNDVLLKRYRVELLPYAMAKAGLSLMTKILAKAWAPEIRVNEICLGYTMPDKKFSTKIKSKWLKEIPMKYFGDAKSVVEASQFLSSQSYITGASLVVDGGVSLK